MKRPATNHVGRCSQMLVDGRQRPLDDTSCISKLCMVRATPSGGVLALHATFRLDSPAKNRHTDPFQTPSKLGHPSYPTPLNLGHPNYPSSIQMQATFPLYKTSCKMRKATVKMGENPKMPYPGRSMKTYTRGNNDAPGITKYRANTNIFKTRIFCGKKN